MRLLFFLLGAKAKNYVNRNKKIAQLLVNAFLILFALFNAILISILLNYLEKEKQTDNVESVLQFLDWAIFITPILLLFVPSFKDKIRFFQKTDPIYPAKRTIIEVIYNFVSSYSLICFFAILLIFFTAAPFTVHQTVLSLEIIFLSNLVCLIIQSFGSIGNKWKLLIAIVFGTIISLFVLFQKTFSTNQIITITIPILLLSYHCMQYLESNPGENKQTTRQSEISLFGLLTRIYFKTRSIKINFTLALIFKTVFLFVLLSKPLDAKFFYLKIFQWLLISSLFFFTYIHNNIWGYIKTTYQMIAQTKNVSLLFKSYTFCLAWTVVVDIAITGSLIIFFKKPSFSTGLIYFSFYATTLFNNIIIGACSSLSMPIEIKKSLDFTSFRSNTSLVGNLLSVLTTSLICFLFINNVGTYFLPVYVILLLYFYYQLIHRNKITKYIKGAYNIF